MYIYLFFFEIIKTAKWQLVRILQIDFKLIFKKARFLGNSAKRKKQGFHAFYYYFIITLFIIYFIYLFILYL